MGMHLTRGYGIELEVSWTLRFVITYIIPFEGEAYYASGGGYATK